VPDEPSQLEYSHGKPSPVGERLPPSVDAADRVEVRSFEHYRRLARAQKEGEFLEISEPGHLRRVWRMLAWLLAIGGTAALFTVLFYYFTNSFRIALIIVFGMLLYMFLAAKLAEGRFDPRNGD
jgi:hypothetical protein